MTAPTGGRWWCVPIPQYTRRCEAWASRRRRRGEAASVPGRRAALGPARNRPRPKALVSLRRLRCAPRADRLPAAVRHIAPLAPSRQPGFTERSHARGRSRVAASADSVPLARSGVVRGAGVAPVRSHGEGRLVSVDLVAGGHQGARQGCRAEAGGNVGLAAHEPSLAWQVVYRGTSLESTIIEQADSSGPPVPLGGRSRKPRSAKGASSSCRPAAGACWTDWLT